MKDARITWRRRPIPDDKSRVEYLCAQSGFFNPEEVQVAGELVEERLVRGLASGYRFWFACEDGSLAGYACYGPIAGTSGSWDLYWVVVDQVRWRAGLGRRLLAKVHSSVSRAGGLRLYAETSSRPLYEPTRRFYLRLGFIEQARLPGFYAPDDDKVIYCLRFAS